MKETLGFYILSAEKLFAVTARHVIFPPGEAGNQPYKQKKYTSQRRHYVTLPGDATLSKLMDDADYKVYLGKFAVEGTQKAIVAAERKGNEALDHLKNVKNQHEVAKHEVAIFENLSKVLKGWKPQENRIVGHAMLSAEIGVDKDPNNYIIDWCIFFFFFFNH